MLLDLKTYQPLICRNRQFQIHQKIFDQADVIVTPTTGYVGLSFLL